MSLINKQSASLSTKFGIIYYFYHFMYQVTVSNLTSDKKFIVKHMFMFKNC